ncbi:MAG: molybdenum cofactor guanylyltransferase [Vulcanimicrobiota bacterium]
MGGQGRRLGGPKAEVLLAGKAMLDHVLAPLRTCCQRVVLVGDHQQSAASRGLESLPDLYPGEGPVGGILTALEATEAAWLLCVAVDLPLLRPELLALLCARMGETQAVVPRLAEPEPLVALYCRGALPAIRAAFDQGERSARRILQHLEVEWVERSELLAVDPELVSFLNVNRAEDLDRARQLLEER